nr:CDP-glucose 4,6-dehydratase [Ferrigenium kumadai]
MHRAQPPVLNLRGLRVLVTGHTGFKGAWLCEWLLQGGASVSGLALPPEGPLSLFDALRLEERLARHIICDIRNPGGVAQAVRETEPEVIFHLAAQALVRRSYQQPLMTWETNVSGTLNLLEAARGLGRPVTVIVVTTDKVYKNREWEFAYREEDELGGHDPYSASKAACELAVDSWRSSFGAADGVTVVTARAGNVIGGGDYSEDRIVPDCFRAWSKGRPVELRNPKSTRPWQHVLEPLSGYMALAAHVRDGSPVIKACNFGPGSDGDHSVETLVTMMAARQPGRAWTVTTAAQPHEARALSLSIDRAKHILGWSPRLTFEETVAWTDAGYTTGLGNLPDLVRQQIADFVNKEF